MHNNIELVNLPEVLLKIFSGYSFRKKVEHDPEGDTAVIQMKDLEAQYTQIGSNLTRVKSESIPKKYHLKPGDVLFIAKGANNYALALEQVDHTTVAASAFFVLRPDPDKVVPGYLAWYLNMPQAQRYFKENTAGTYIPNINLSIVKRLKVKVPTLEVQQRISFVNALARKEQYILTTLKEKKKILVDNLLIVKIEEEWKK